MLDFQLCLPLYTKEGAGGFILSAPGRGCGSDRDRRRPAVPAEHRCRGWARPDLDPECPGQMRRGKNLVGSPESDHPPLGGEEQQAMEVSAARSRSWETWSTVTPVSG